MSKLYIFGIGGTGSRVLKSLTMLLAAGVKINGKEIVPIIIDPDYAAADLTRTVSLMQNYSRIRSKMDFDTSTENDFFRTNIDLTSFPSIIMPLSSTQDVKFKEYIGLETMRNVDGNHNANYALASILFSELNLNSSMDVGFKGNPNIGSVVLNQFSNSDHFENFASSFKQGDGIFIISSIFGGTGASGFPLLLKNIRAIQSSVPGGALVKNAPIGAISVLPYFDVMPNEDSEIVSSTFVSKTRAALSYYDKNINEANAIYYIADTKSKQYKNSEGGTMQRNDAHFVELAAALAIIDFASFSSTVVNNNGIPSSTIYKEFGINNDSNEILFGDLSQQTLNIIQKPLLQFVLFTKYLKEQVADSYSVSTWSKEHDFDRNFFASEFYNSDLTSFRNCFLEWLDEMATNDRAFTPFDLSEKKSNVFSLVKGMDPAKLRTFASNYALFDRFLNDEQLNVKKDSNIESRFVELFYKTTKKITNEKFRL